MPTGRFWLKSDPARYDVLPRLVQSVLRPSGNWVDDDVLERCYLAVHELLVNVTMHAYRGRTGLIDLHISIGPRVLFVSVHDEGLPFDGDLDRRFPAEPSLAGYGLPLVRTLADDVRYTRRGAENHWHLEFLRQRPPEL
jgi:anti-sigma regulatory factor (Ser/Thr protein kinase)